MSTWGDIFAGLTEGVLNAAAYQADIASRLQGVTERGLVFRLSRESGWQVDERDGDTVLLHFTGSGGGIRKVRIAGGDSTVVTFSASSFAVIHARDVPVDTIAYLLRRNIDSSVIGMWGMTVDEEARVMFHVLYQALGAGLNAPAFQYVCESLVNEAADFDLKLRQSGLLR